MCPPTRLVSLALTALALPAVLMAQEPRARHPSWSIDLDRAMVEAGAALEASRTALGVHVAAVAPALAAARVSLAQAGVLLSVTFDQGSTSRGLAARPPEPWAEQDPADSLYREARSALNRDSYAQAAYLFSQIYSRYPKSSYAPDAYYWEAFARYRRGGEESLNAALEALKQQEKLHPNAPTRGDARALATRIQGQLARHGDSDAAEVVAREAARAAQEDARDRERDRREQERERRELERERAHGERERVREHRSERCSDDDDDMQTAALNALLQMDVDRAVPILKKVLARRDPGSVCLRRKAVFLVSQHQTSETETILLNAARTDPDAEVRGQAIFWLSQVSGERAVAALDSILQTATDQELQDKAIFALSQHSSARAQQALRDFALRTSAPMELREKAIFWIGQSDRAGGDNAAFLRTLYKTIKETELKDKILFSVSQSGGRESQRWLIEIAGNQAEDIELRKKAPFWAGQSGTSLPELFELYDKMPDREMREQLIFVYSQRNDKAAVDRLIQIARTEKDKELRKKALFWLSQSHDPRVPELLQEILEKS